MAEKLERLKHLCMHCHFLMLPTFQFICVHLCNNIYFIFRFEQINNLSFSISKMLCSYVFKMLFYKHRATSFIVTSLDTTKTFKLVEQTVIGAINEFLWMVQQNDLNFPSQKDFSKGYFKDRVFEFFDDHGKIGKLKKHKFVFLHWHMYPNGHHRRYPIMSLRRLFTSHQTGIEYRSGSLHQEHSLYLVLDDKLW